MRLVFVVLLFGCYVFFLYYRNTLIPGGVLKKNRARELQVVGCNPGLMTDPSRKGGREIKIFVWVLHFGMNS